MGKIQWQYIESANKTVRALEHKLDDKQGGQQAHEA